jgi:hypothetical protein
MRAILPAPVMALCPAGLLAAIVLVSHAQEIQRCESADGKVTYSNSKCPDGTAPVRSVNTSPPVAVDDQKAAAERAKHDTDQLKAMEKTRDKEAADARRTAAEQNKAQAKDRGRCDKASKGLAEATDARAALHRKSATIQQMQKADDEIAKRERDVAKACPS